MKLKIMDKKPAIPDDEIRKLMDFDGLIRQHARGRASSPGIRWTFIGLGVIPVVAIGVYLAWQEPKEIVSNQPRIKQTEVEPGKPELKSHENKILPLPAEKPKNTQPTGKTLSNEPEKANENEPQSVYHEAEPLSGFPKFYEYLNNEIVYPIDIVKDSIQGVESVSFVIDDKGNLGSVTVLHSLGKPFDDEALRLLHHMPAWKAASLNGKPVASRISLPLTFSIGVVKKEKP